MASKILNLGNKDCGEEEEEPPVSNSGTSSGTSSSSSSTSSSESDGYRDDLLGPCQSKSDCPSDAICEDNICVLDYKTACYRSKDCRRMITPNEEPNYEADRCCAFAAYLPPQASTTHIDPPKCVSGPYDWNEGGDTSRIGYHYFCTNIGDVLDRCDHYNRCLPGMHCEAKMNGHIPLYDENSKCVKSHDWLPCADSSECALMKNGKDRCCAKYGQRWNQPLGPIDPPVCVRDSDLEYECIGRSSVNIM